MTYTAENSDNCTAYLLKNCDTLLCDDFQIEKTISEGGKHLCPQAAIKSTVACINSLF